MKPKRMILVKASVAGDWFPNSCMDLVRLSRRGLDVEGLYEVLGIGTDATEAEIKSAAKKRMLESHPDVGGDASEFELVLKAYKTLSDSGKRALYDSREHAGTVAICRTVYEAEEPVRIQPKKRACFYKGMSDMLTEDDIETVYAWQDMVLAVARRFGASFEVEVGISDKIDRYLIQDGVALIPSKSKPDMGMAKAYVLYKMTQKEK